MKPIETAVRWRHGTLALFFLLALLGVLALFGLPLELQPGGDRPEISISTPYPGAAPSEVEDLVTRPLEDVLEQVEGIRELSSTSSLGNSSITIEFDWGVDLDDRLVAVLNKLQQADELPEEALESDVQVSNGGGASAMMWMVLQPEEGRLPDSDRYRDLVDEIVVPRLRRVEGTSRFLVVGGREREVEVLVDPQALADRDLSVLDVTDALRDNNQDVRGGPLVLGRREYRVSTESRADTVEDLENFVLRRDDSGTVYLRDVARANMGRKFRDSFFLYNDEPSVAIGTIRRVGANVPEVSRGLREAIVELNDRFARDSEAVRIEVFYDESDYIDGAVALVQGNLVLGGILATIVLILFLGSLRTVAVCGISIPATIVMAFIVMAATGQTLNIISLAGLAFAVGMVVDYA
ncbi:MAG: efflux RND transporter permease subunit, partial [Cyanobacteria bacterium J06641_5]